MTSPENPEEPTGDKAAPPWQRLGKDDASPNGSAEAETVWLPGGQPTENVVHAEGDNSDKTTFVTSSVSQGLFGKPLDPPPANPGPAAPGVMGGNTREAPSALRRPGRGPRRASLQVKRFDPWSVLKLSLVLGVAMFFVWLVAVGVLYTVLDGMGVWDKLNGTYSSLVSGEGSSAPADPLISAGRVFSIAAILGAINIVLLSALTTVSAFIYNVSADLAGGLEVTLSERE
ncbi:DUF3566 domain-containing protein [Amycolatopsis pigmentata]|uniref:DUF3566 domain-containing protein n=1 Tax=Amycolatopsis pigmentata TaxID=450801 RepID=A0ABW5FUW9_9PSEU